MHLRPGAELKNGMLIHCRRWTARAGLPDLADHVGGGSHLVHILLLVEVGTQQLLDDVTLAQPGHIHLYQQVQGQETRPGLPASAAHLEQQAGSRM